jgi:RimJ/RimL family protein N-acetyltransferase
MRPTLHTERLTLRPVDGGDLDDLVALNADPEVMAFIGTPMTRAEVEAEHPAWVTGDDDFGLWVGTADGDFAGVWFLSRDPDDRRAGEIGWRLSRPAWGRGYAVEGARAIVGHAFGALALDRVWAETMAVNTRSRRVMETLGMTLLRTYVGEWDEPIAGCEQGEVVYGLAAFGGDSPPPAGGLPPSAVG